jgi:hypothetical protein
MPLRLWILAVLLFPMVAWSDSYSPSHSCRKPYKPFEFSDRYEYDNFMSDVASYKRCIATFVDEQKSEAQHHSDAADEAIDEWNSFVRRELN